MLLTIDNLEIAYKKGYNAGKAAVMREARKALDLLANSIESADSAESLAEMVKTCKKYISYMTNSLE